MKPAVQAHTVFHSACNWNVAGKQDNFLGWSVVHKSIQYDKG